jgi:hypothetical protein
MYSTEWPLAHACRPTACAMKVLPTPVCPISSSERPSLSQPNEQISLTCALLMEREAVKSKSSKLAVQSLCVDPP